MAGEKANLGAKTAGSKIPVFAEGGSGSGGKGGGGMAKANAGGSSQDYWLTRRKLEVSSAGVKYFLMDIYCYFFK